MDIYSKPEYMRDYIAHLQFTRERLIETYTMVKNRSRFIATEVWQDSVSMQFMEMLDQKQKDLYRITEELEHQRTVMLEQLEVAERIANQSI